MHKFLMFLVGMLMFGCYQPKPEYPLPDKKDICNVIKAVIEQERIVNLFDNNTGNLISREKGKKKFITLKDFPLSADLYKIDASVNGSESDRSINPGQLIKSGYFTKADSAYILFQNSIISRTQFKIDTSAMPGMRYTSDVMLKSQLLKGRRNLQYSKFSIPFFSLDRQSAFIELEATSGFNMGAGYHFILRKINGGWIIVKQWQTWVA